MVNNVNLQAREQAWQFLGKGEALCFGALSVGERYNGFIRFY